MLVILAPVDSWLRTPALMILTFHTTLSSVLAHHFTDKQSSRDLSFFPDLFVFIYF